MFLNSYFVCCYFIIDLHVSCFYNTVPYDTLFVDQMNRFCVDLIVFTFLYIGTQGSENSMFMWIYRHQ